MGEQEWKPFSMCSCQKKYRLWATIVICMKIERLMGVENDFGFL
jgi:hypothetical protein